MATRRPSYVSIRRRQRNIIEGMGTGDLKYAETAKRLGVTQKQLRHFLETRPKKLRPGFNRSPATRKLYAEGERSEVRKELGIKRIKRYEFRENVLHDKINTPTNKDFLIGRAVQRLYYVNDQHRQDWSVFARENGLPNSIKAIQKMYRDGQLSDRRYRSILVTWKKIYSGMNETHFSSYMEEVDEDYEADE